ncbi:MAG: divalent-cation tolerance protein CutA [Desulfurococcales archaeon]|nr:divalent-cation tolerance protein CutA [Desulfurococcales archaeon]
MAFYQRIVVFITAPRDKAEELSRKLVEEKLAACVNIVNKVDSIYWWEGKVERDSESLLVLKTELGLLGKLAKKVKELHPYEVPEIIALPIIGGNPDYLKWISDSLGQEEV